ncbi:MAG: 1-acyl-sn-glycerol-3-phosphate acyltransferase, partial [Gammaproteobacteria bacterium]|nr:1-acyl-sn-glycerol-3-phosphate acyltransferase [Gammaproteobacteria bacterium]
SVQTLALTYTRLHGLPLGRRGRPQVAWYGDMDMASHAWKLLGLGPLDANIRIGPPVPLDDFPDRKALARYTE